MRRIMPSPRAAGFSLIEALVAMVILALSLGALYQAAAGATRNVRVDERYTYAVQIAQSLLAEHPFVQPDGISVSGEMGDFQWRLSSSVYAAGVQAAAPGVEAATLPVLHQLVALVRWEGVDGREVSLTTLVPEWVPPPLLEADNGF
jgi:general secretion pathway protein I